MGVCVLGARAGAHVRSIPREFQGQHLLASMCECSGGILHDQIEDIRWNFTMCGMGRLESC